MKFHTRLGTRMKLSDKEIRRQFDGLTIAVRTFWGRTPEGKKRAHAVSLVRVVDGVVLDQILAENKEGVGPVCAHLMRWLDKTGSGLQAPSRSRDRSTKKHDAARKEETHG